MLIHKTQEKAQIYIYNKHYTYLWEKVYFKVILEIKYHRPVKTIVAGDESWCFVYDPQTKRQSPTWLSPGPQIGIKN